MQRPKETFKERLAKELTLKKLKSYGKEALILGMQYSGWMEAALTVGLALYVADKGRRHGR